MFGLIGVVGSRGESAKWSVLVGNLQSGRFSWGICKVVGSRCVGPAKSLPEQPYKPPGASLGAGRVQRPGARGEPAKSIFPKGRTCSKKILPTRNDIRPKKFISGLLSKPAYKHTARQKSLQLAIAHTIVGANITELCI